MKQHHPGWLAAGLLLAVVLACNLSKNSNNSNNRNTNSNSSASTSEETPNRPADADVYVDEINMAKDNDGNPGEEATTFEPANRTIHCVIKLNKAKGGTKIRFDWKAVDVQELGNGNIRSIDYTTKSFENSVHAHLTLPRDWPKGAYQVNVYINGALDKQIKYTVE
jgi:hypothetical protein